MLEHMDVVAVADKAGYFVNVVGEVLSAWYPNGVGRAYTIRDDLPLRKLKPRLNGKGYCRVSLGKSNDRYIHRLVWAAYNGPIPKGLQIRHLDGNRANNRLTNLALGTQKDNELDKLGHGTLMLGETHVNSKLTVKDVLLAREMWAKGFQLLEIKEVLRLEVGKGTIHAAVIGKTWKHC